MNFSPDFFGSLITRSGGWQATLDGSHFSFQTKGKQVSKYPYESITKIDCKTGIVWATIRIECSEKVIEFDGIANAKGQQLAESLHKQVEDTIRSSLTLQEKAISELAYSLATFLNQPYYLAHSDIIKWAAKQQSAGGQSTMQALQG